MEKLEINGKIVIFLKHKDLVNEYFNEIKKNTTKSFELRDELFFFHSKSKPDNAEKKADVANALEQNSTSSNKNFKKRKFSEAQNSDISGINKNLTKILDAIKVKKEVLPSSNTEASTSGIPRYWEEVHNFPKFKGANHTNEIQHFSFGKQTYLIPPKCQFYNYNVTDLNEILQDLGTYDLIVLDPPWRNKYIRRLKRSKHELAYSMLDNEELQRLPISKIIAPNSLVAVWCTNSQQHQAALEKEFLPSWNLRLVHVVTWFKINTSYELISSINKIGNKQPFEKLYLACHKDGSTDFTSLKKVDYLISIPSIVHSHKPPILKWLSEYLPENPNCVEFFARYLQPNFTSIGLEVLKLMDERLYRCA